MTKQYQFKGRKMSTDKQIEQEIQDKGLTAPRITPQDIEDNIDSEVSFVVGKLIEKIEGSEHIHPSLNLLTICVITLANGFVVTGESACASPENFDEEVGHKIARANAINKIWPLMGYELRSKLAK